MDSSVDDVAGAGDSSDSRRLAAGPCSFRGLPRCPRPLLGEAEPVAAAQDERLCRGEEPRDEEETLFADEDEEDDHFPPLPPPPLLLPAPPALLPGGRPRPLMAADATATTAAVAVGEGATRPLASKAVARACDGREKISLIAIRQ